MEPLTKLLARIDSKLNLILPIVAQYQTQIPTVVARLKIAQIHSQEKDAKRLFFDLEWITRNLLGRKALAKKFEGFEHQILDLHLLKEDLKKYLSFRKSGGALGDAVARWRKKLLHSLETMEHDLIIIREKTENAKVFSSELGRTINDFLMSEQALKTEFWKQTLREEDIIRLCSLMGEEINNINQILIKAKQIDLIQALRKVLLQDWNNLIEILILMFEEAYPRTATATERKVPIVRKDKGVNFLEAQA